MSDPVFCFHGALRTKVPLFSLIVSHNPHLVSFAHAEAKNEELAQEIFSFFHAMDWSDKACYSPSEDKIFLPKCGQFESAEAFYATAYHECGHSTGHVNRLNRKGLQNVRFGSETYSKEELIAELVSATLVHELELGIETESCFQNSASLRYS